MQPQILPWCDPLALASRFDGPLALLYSSVQTGYSGGVSVLAAHAIETVELGHFDALVPLLRHNQPRFAHAWFGYFSYEMKHDVEHYSEAERGRYHLPRARLVRFAKVFVFDHAAKTLTLWSEQKEESSPISAWKEISLPVVTALSSNMTRAEYEQKVAHILRDIAAGNLYQANLTRKFYGEWDAAPDGLSLFAKLCAVSPAPYSAYLRFAEAEILSSSPEMFLRLEPDGMVTTRPIKGSAPRFADAAADRQSREQLAASDKNRAENLMIADLMRSDLSRVCKAGSVKVEGLFEVTTHATIHHMASTASGILAENLPELLRATFPPGSMTGAPKIRAVELCNALEGVERGIYSGAIGWLGGDGCAELSVVIRTLILHGNQFEFQVGGGIVADSTPESEWRETMDKAVGILRTLGIERGRIEEI